MADQIHGPKDIHTMFPAGVYIYGGLNTGCYWFYQGVRGERGKQQHGNCEVKLI